MTMPPRDSSEARLKRTRLIRQAVERVAHHTEFFQTEGRCTLGEATVVLMELEREGYVQRGDGWKGMTWKLAPSGQKDRGSDG
jgi:hypothetical protein